MCFSGLPVCPAASVCLSSVLPTRGNLQYIGYQNTVVRALQSEWIFIQHFTVSGSRENYLGNLFASSFLQKEESPLTHCMISNYDAGQEIRTRTPESSGSSTGEIPKLPEG